jgi:hypothetical protein
MNRFEFPVMPSKASLERWGDNPVNFRSVTAFAVLPSGQSVGGASPQSPRRNGDMSEPKYDQSTTSMEVLAWK